MASTFNLHEGMTYEAMSAILDGMSCGSFLFRRSASKPGWLVVGFVNAQGAVRQVQIEVAPDGMLRPLGGEERFPSLHAFVEHYANALKNYVAWLT